MKPSFALNFTDDAVVLLHRSGRGWIEVGQAKFADADFAESVAYLRSTALELSPKGFSSKLLIPPSQILHMQVDVVANGDDEIRAEIAKALEGRTPYDVSDLIFDWSGKGSSKEVAVVARETLEEAEAFARDNKLNPVAFAAVAPDGFDRDAFFGPSSVASDYLPKGKKVQADTDATIILSAPSERPNEDEPPAEPEPEVTEEVAEEPSAPEEASAPKPAEEPVVEDEVEETEAAATSDNADDVVTEAAVQDEPEAEAPLAQDELESAAEAVPEPEAIADEAEAPAVEAQPEIVEEPEPLVEAKSEEEIEAEPPKSAETKQASFDLDAAPVMAAPEPEPVTSESDEAPMALDVEDEETIRPKTMSESLRRAASKSAAPLSAPPVAIAVPETQDDDLPPAPAQSILAAFASRRSAEAQSKGKVADPRLRIAKDQAADGAKRVPPPVTSRPTAKPAAGDRPAPKVAKFSYDDPVPPPPRLPGDPPVGPVGVMGKASKGLKSLGTLVSSPSLPGRGAKSKPAEAPEEFAEVKTEGPVLKPTAPEPAPAPLPAEPISLSAAREALKANAPADDMAFSKPAALGKTLASAKITPLGKSAKPPVEPDALARGLGARRDAVGGKPKYLGLILTGVLLLMLAIVAAWSSYYLAGGGQIEDPTAVVQSDSTAAAEAEADLADVADDPAPTGDVVAPEKVNAETALADAEPAVVPEPTAAEPAATEPAPAELVAEPAAEEAAVEPPGPAPETGIVAEAAAARPSSIDQDEIFLSAMDVAPSLSDPVVVAKPVAAADAPPSAQMPPPPFGTVYKFDTDGNIIPTKEGIVTPDGVTLFAGKPVKVPQPRPDAVTAAALAANPAPAAAPAAEPSAIDAAVAEAASADVLPADTFGALPALKDARPRSRPAGLTPAASDAGQDDASLAPAEGSRFASLRPRLRPQTVLAAGEDARRASEAASLALQAAAASAAAAAVDDAARGNVSPLAVTVSLKPAPRPRNLQRAVEAAVVSATRQPEKKAAEPQHEEDDGEPEIRASAPRIPTKANVAKQATFVNAINLSKLNLIGVYGTSSKRYALVRQSNARIKKVRVGDSLDGGRVEAITASEVRYQKGGRLLSLKLPKG